MYQQYQRRFQHHAEKVQAAVQMHSAVRESGSVLDLAAGHPPVGPEGLAVGENLDRKELQKGLEAVECTGSVAVIDHYPLRLHAEFVALRRQPRIEEVDAFPGR